MCLSACIYVHHRDGTHRDQKGLLRSDGAGVTDGCELPCGSWEQNSGLL